MIMKNFVSDELANKIYHLTKALEQAKEIISKLEQENERLQSLVHISEENSVSVAA